MADDSVKFYTIELPNGQRLRAQHGANLRDLLKQHFEQLYNGVARWIHCRGLGTCGTCSLKVEGPTSKPTGIEKWRLNVPPHRDSLQKGLRLACQTQVFGNLKISKWNGLWGSLESGDQSNDRLCSDLRDNVSSRK